MTDSKNNTGTENSGNWNSGNRNSGNRNSGNLNGGDWNSGTMNSGNLNGGNWNSGTMNSGNRNSGNWNSGYRNSGNWNSGNQHNGCFNTGTAEQAYYFNALCSVEVWNNAAKPDWIYRPSPTTWVAEENMTDAEKVDNKDFHTTGGYLCKNDMHVEWQEAMESATAEEIQQVRDLPQFDAEVFKEITGLDLTIKKPTTCEGKTIVVDGVEYELKAVK